MPVWPPAAREEAFYGLLTGSFEREQRDTATPTGRAQRNFKPNYYEQNFTLIARQLADDVVWNKLRCLAEGYVGCRW